MICLVCAVHKNANFATVVHAGRTAAEIVPIALPHPLSKLQSQKSKGQGSQRDKVQ